MVGVVPTRDAIQRAIQAGLDLIEVSPNAEPPVCKILDYGKYKYEQQKKKHEAKKKQKTVDIKEVKFRPMIGEHDYQIKMKQVHKFLGAGNKVKISLRFRGREMAHQDLGMKIFERIQEEIVDIGAPENKPKLEGRQIIMMIAPTKK
jgi:translation initiation factor IF-3